MFGNKKIKTQGEINLAELKKWEARDKKNLLLVHTVRTQYLNNSVLLTQDAQSVFKTWDIVSTSLIDLKALKKNFGAVGRRGHVATGLFFEAGFILEVPTQNILGTFPRDAWFPNHAGVDMKNQRIFDKSALSDSIFSGKAKKPSKNIEGGYNKIVDPRKILSQTNSSYYNEIIVIGRPNISLYPGLLATREIKVAGIILAPKYVTNSSEFFKQQARKESRKAGELMMKHNPGIPVIEL